VAVLSHMKESGVKTQLPRISTLLSLIYQHRRGAIELFRKLGITCAAEDRASQCVRVDEPELIWLRVKRRLKSES
jgi:hypothetical protein